MPTFRSSEQAFTVSSSSFNCLKPAGTQPGDMLLSLHSTSGNFGSSEEGISGGDPWVRISTGNNFDRIHWKIAGASETSFYTMTNTFPSAGGTAIIIAISNPVLTAPIVSAPTANASGLVAQTPSFTPVGFDGLDFRWLTDTSTTTGFATSPPAGYTELHDFETGKLYSVLAFKQLTSETSAGIQSFTSNKTFSPTGYSINVTGPLAMPFTGWGMPI